MAIQDNQGMEAYLMLRWSDDCGETWSNQLTASMGKVGEYKKRVKFFRLGQSRDRIFEISISDPVKRVITGANLEAKGGTN